MPRVIQLSKAREHSLVARDRNPEEQMIAEEPTQENHTAAKRAERTKALEEATWRAVSEWFPRLPKLVQGGMLAIWTDVMGYEYKYFVHRLGIKNGTLRKRKCVALKLCAPCVVDPADGTCTQVSECAHRLGEKALLDLGQAIAPDILREVDNELGTP